MEFRDAVFPSTRQVQSHQPPRAVLNYDCEIKTIGLNAVVKYTSTTVNTTKIEKESLCTYLYASA